MTNSPRPSSSPYVTASFRHALRLQTAGDLGRWHADMLAAVNAGAGSVEQLHAIAGELESRKA